MNVWIVIMICLGINAALVGGIWTDSRKGERPIAAMVGAALAGCLLLAIFSLCMAHRKIQDMLLPSAE